MNIFNCYEICEYIQLLWNYRVVIFYLHVSQFVQFWNAEINSNAQWNYKFIKSKQSCYTCKINFNFLLIKTLITIVLPIQSKE